MRKRYGLRMARRPRARGDPVALNRRRWIHAFAATTSGRHRAAFGLLACALTFATLLAVPRAHAEQPIYPEVGADERFTFPRDHGAHPAFRTEWWYVTGWLRTRDGDELGFQVTFFRSRLPIADSNPSRFAPKQLLFAHAALADAKVGHLLADQRIARAGFGIAQASDRDADISLDGWRLMRVAPDKDRVGEHADAESLHFKTRVAGDRFALDLDLRATGPVLAQGADAARPGYSQKGPQARDASRYYSVPQLTVSGTIVRSANSSSKKERIQVTGTAWLDREWSSAYLDPRAVGWDWVGLNFDDGGALMAFQMRDRDGGKLWAGGARRFADGRVERYAPDDLRFAALRSWTSPASGATWPVMQRIVIAAQQHGPLGSGPSPQRPINASTPDPVAPAKAGVQVGSVSPLAIVVEPLMDNQELDSRLSTGTIYWEGAVRVHQDDATHAQIGKGYLESTGYWQPIRFGFQ